VDGSARVFDAVRAAGVPALVYASSVGAYSPGPKDRRVDETWPTDGIPTSFYSRHKAAVERLLDAFEREAPQVRVVRMRPGLIFKRDAASGIRRLFAGPFLPSPLVRPDLLPILPLPPGLRFQAVHSHCVGEAYRRAVTNTDARGSFNLAADPVLDPAELGRAFSSRPVSVSPSVLRAAAQLTFKARLQPSEPGWFDMAMEVPLMDTARARDVLGWTPRRDSTGALLELVEGIRDSAGTDTPPLSPATSGRFRTKELAGGIGAREVG
jgi:nucleoside-diphosphate-sugar epimerase